MSKGYTDFLGKVVKYAVETSETLKISTEKLFGVRPSNVGNIVELLRGFLRQVDGDADKRFVHLARDLREALGSEAMALEALKLYQEEKKMKGEAVLSALSDLTTVLCSAATLGMGADYMEEGPDDEEPGKDEQKEQD